MSLLPVDPLVLAAFVPAALALNLTPGADMMFCLGQGLRAGARNAAWASAGIALGGMVHVALAGLGLGALVAARPWLLEAIRWIGVGYLLWLAWGALRHGAALAAAPAAVAPGGSRRSAARAFRAGLWVNLTNPKVILFVLAFIPQFIDPVGAPILAQFLTLGAILSLGGFAVNALVGLFAGRSARWLGGNPRAPRILGAVSGTIFTLLALRLALSERG